MRRKFLLISCTACDFLKYDVIAPYISIQASFVNLNLGSVALAGVMLLFGSLTSFLWTTFIPKYKNLSNNNGETNTTTTGEAEDGPSSEEDDTTTAEDGITTADENNTENDSRKTERGN